MANKIGVSQIQLYRYEGPVEDCGRSWAADWGGAEVALTAWARTAPGGVDNPREGGYDKCHFMVVWTNGYEYHGRFDLTGNNAHELPMQVARELALAAGAWRPSWMSPQQYARVQAMYARAGDAGYRARCGNLLDTLDLDLYGPVGGGLLALGGTEGRVIDQRPVAVTYCTDPRHETPCPLPCQACAEECGDDDDDAGVEF